MGSNNEKNGGRKSRDTFPLREQCHDSYTFFRESISSRSLIHVTQYFQNDFNFEYTVSKVWHFLTLLCHWPRAVKPFIRYECNWHPWCTVLWMLYLHCQAKFDFCNSSMGFLTFYKLKRKLQMNFTPPHQQMFIEFSIFPKKNSNSACYWPGSLLWQHCTNVHCSISRQFYVMTSIAFWWYPDPKKYVCKQ